MRGGIDRVVISCSGVWRDEPFSRLTQAFKAAKEKMKANDQHSMMVEIGGGHAVELFAMGNKKGQGPYYQFVFRVDGVAIYMSSQQQWKGTMPNIIIDVGSMACITTGGRLGPLWRGLKTFLGSIGFKVEFDKLSRIDVCVDLCGVHVEQFVSMYDRGWLVTRARSRCKYECESVEHVVQVMHDANRAIAERKGTGYVASYQEVAAYLQQQAEAGTGDGRVFGSGMSPTGVSVGKNQVCRIYDKRREVLSDPIKTRALVENRWGGELPDAVTRIEFQMRRDGITSRGIDCCDDWIAKEGEVVEYLCEQWFVFRADPNRNNRKKAPVAKLWETVQRGFREAFKAREADRVRIGSAPSDAGKLLPMAKGVLFATAAAKHGKVGSAAELADVLVGILHDVWGMETPEQHLHEYNQRCDLLEARMVRFGEAISPVEPWDQPEPNRFAVVDEWATQAV